MAIPPDLMNMIQGASQGGPDTGGPVGPDDLVGGPDTGGPPGPDNFVGGPDTGGPVGPDNFVGGPDEEPGGNEPTPVELLRNVLEGLKDYQDVETDDIDLEIAAKVYALVQKLLAKNQQESEAAAGVTPVHKGLAKAQAGGGGY